jgi:hypothetical protein
MNLKYIVIKIMKKQLLLNQRLLIKRHKLTHHVIKNEKNKKRDLLLTDMLKTINIFETRIELMKLELK